MASASLAGAGGARAAGARTSPHVVLAERERRGEARDEGAAGGSEQVAQLAIISRALGGRRAILVGACCSEHTPSRVYAASRPAFCRDGRSDLVENQDAVANFLCD